MTSGIRVNWQAADVSGSRRAAAGSVLARFAAEVEEPAMVEVTFTDRFDATVERLLPQQLHSSGVTQGATYSSSRLDGARAVAKTMELTGSRIAVVASTGLLADLKTAERALVHEAQHVRLIQHGDIAYAVHRRAPFELPDDLTWVFMWMAESALDEFRCERAVYDRRLAPLDPAVGSRPQDHPAIAAGFREAAHLYRRTRNVMQTLAVVVPTLDRLATFLAYGAAAAAVGPMLRGWDVVPAMAAVLDVLRDVPGTSETVELDRLLTTSVELARALRRILQQAGFDYYPTSDGGTFLEVLR